MEKIHQLIDTIFTKKGLQYVCLINHISDNCTTLDKSTLIKHILIIDKKRKFFQRYIKSCNNNAGNISSKIKCGFLKHLEEFENQNKSVKCSNQSVNRSVYYDTDNQCPSNHILNISCCVPKNGYSLFKGSVPTQPNKSVLFQHISKYMLPKHDSVKIGRAHV